MSCGGGGHGRGGSRADITHARRLAETGRATVQPLTAPSDPHLRVRVTGRVGSSARPASGRVSSRPSRSWGVLAWRIAAQTRSQPSRVGGWAAGDGDPGAHGRGVRVKGAIGGGERGRGRARGGDRWRRGAPVCRRRLLARGVRLVLLCHAKRIAPTRVRQSIDTRAQVLLGPWAGVRSRRWSWGCSITDTLSDALTGSTIGPRATAGGARGRVVAHDQYRPLQRHGLPRPRSSHGAAARWGPPWGLSHTLPAAWRGRARRPRRSTVWPRSPASAPAPSPAPPSGSASPAREQSRRQRRPDRHPGRPFRYGPPGHRPHGQDQDAASPSPAWGVGFLSCLCYGQTGHALARCPTVAAPTIAAPRPHPP